MFQRDKQHLLKDIKRAVHYGIIFSSYSPVFFLNIYYEILGDPSNPQEIAELKSQVSGLEDRVVYIDDSLSKLSELVTRNLKISEDSKHIFSNQTGPNVWIKEEGNNNKSELKKRRIVSTPPSSPTVLLHRSYMRGVDEDIDSDAALATLPASMYHTSSIDSVKEGLKLFSNTGSSDLFGFDPEIWDSGATRNDLVDALLDGSSVSIGMDGADDCSVSSISLCSEDLMDTPSLEALLSTENAAIGKIRSTAVPVASSTPKLSPPVGPDVLEDISTTTSTLNPSKRVTEITDKKLEEMATTMTDAISILEAPEAPEESKVKVESVLKVLVQEVSRVLTVRRQRFEVARKQRTVIEVTPNVIIPRMITGSNEMIQEKPWQLSHSHPHVVVS